MTSPREPRQRRWSYVAALAASTMLGAALLSRAACAPVHGQSASDPDDLETARTAAEAATPSASPQSPSSAEPGAPARHTSAAQANATDGAAVHTPPGGGSPLDTPASDTAPLLASPSTVPRVDSRELPLLASIERELKRDPPREVHALLGEYRAGAQRAALIERVQTHFPPDLPLRVITLRWIDDVLPAADGTKVPGPKTPVVTTAPGWVKPLRQP